MDTLAAWVFDVLVPKVPNIANVFKCHDGIHQDNRAEVRIASEVLHALRKHVP